MYNTRACGSRLFNLPQNKNDIGVKYACLSRIDARHIVSHPLLGQWNVIKLNHAHVREYSSVSVHLKHTAYSTQPLEPMMHHRTPNSSITHARKTYKGVISCAVRTHLCLCGCYSVNCKLMHTEQCE